MTDREVVCDLCGGARWESAAIAGEGRVLISDGRVVPGVLRKRRCLNCGLVAGDGPGGADASELYDRHYAQGLAPEHQFMSASGLTPRSAVIEAWITGARIAPLWERASRVLEVGAGNGRLLERLAARFPRAGFQAIEPGRAAAAAARARGLEVRSTPVEALDREAFDLIYAVTVLEHVASPSAFLAALRRALRPGGSLVLVQPTQDRAGSDVLFVDHLHHFGSAHLAAYARLTGYDETCREIGHPLMPSFSLHVWRRAEADAAAPAWSAPPLPTRGLENLRAAAGDMARVSALVDQLAEAGRRLAVFGVAEVYTMAAAYSRLGDHPPVCGLSDVDPAPALPFPVVRPEAAAAFGITDVLLTMNRMYYPAAHRRLSPLGVAIHEVWSDEAPGSRDIRC